MTYTEVLKEEGDWRVTLIVDDSPEEPWDDGQCPLLRIDRTGYCGVRAEHIMVGGMRPTDSDARIEEAAVRFQGNQELLEKYLRAYHGATVVKWYGPNQATDYTYVAYDTPGWVEAIGYDDKISPRASYDASKAVQMNEYQAYLEGDVWGYTVERKVHVHQDKRIHASSEPYFRAESTEYDEWEDIDSCWGFYGHEYAENCALEALQSAQEG